MVLLVNAANAINGGSYRMKEYISSPKNIITCFFIPGHNHPPFPAPLRFGTPENQFNSIASTHPFPPPQKIRASPSQCLPAQFITCFNSQEEALPAHPHYSEDNPSSGDGDFKAARRKHRPSGRYNNRVPLNGYGTVLLG